MCVAFWLGKAWKTQWNVRIDGLWLLVRCIGRLPSRATAAPEGRDHAASGWRTGTRRRWSERIRWTACRKTSTHPATRRVCWVHREWRAHLRLVWQSRSALLRPGSLDARAGQRALADGRRGPCAVPWLLRRTPAVSVRELVHAGCGSADMPRLRANDGRDHPVVGTQPGGTGDDPVARAPRRLNRLTSSSASCSLGAARTRPGRCCHSCARGRRTGT